MDRHIQQIRAVVGSISEQLFPHQNEVGHLMEQTHAQEQHLLRQKDSRMSSQLKYLRKCQAQSLNEPMRFIIRKCTQGLIEQLLTPS